MTLDRPHLPRQEPIDSYGNGGFRFADMSHRGSILSLPSGIWAWNVGAAAEIDLPSLENVFAESDAIDFIVIGTGAAPAPLDAEVRTALQQRALGLELLATGAAVRTYNILLAERRRVAAALIAVG
jgi:uncharacterized protein